MSTQIKGTLYLIPTPLAEHALEKSVVPELKEIVKDLEFYAVEDVRTARRFISSLKLGLDIETLDFQVLNKKTTDLEIEKILGPSKKGKSIGLMSEAGCPGVADPGARAVAKAHEWNCKVHPITGPSSILLALMASGFSGQQFCFHGYLPIKSGELIKSIKEIEEESVRKAQTQIFIETPYRNNKLFDLLVNNCNPSTRLCVAKNLTGEDEAVVTRTVKAWKANKIDLHKIPTIFLLMA